MALIVFKTVNLTTMAPLGNVLLSSVGGPGPWQTVSDPCGTAFTDLSPAHYDITFSHPGYETITLPADLGDPGVVTQGLVPTSKPIPPPPSRDQVGNVNLTFQGLIVNTEQYGTLPWFEAALVSLSPADRQAVYAAKRGKGDTHCIVAFQWSYDEANQPYQHIPGRDFTGNTAEYVGLVEEVVKEGFIPMCFLGGDDGENGFPIAVSQVKELGPALGELVKYVLVIPGWDGVFYGYTPQHITDFAVEARKAGFIYVGVEHQPGRIPVGNGPVDYQPGGMMSGYDVILTEMENWPTVGDAEWQVAGRLLGPAYIRPAAQQGDPTPPFYLAPGSSRGPYFTCAFEYGEFNFVRDSDVQKVDAARSYYRSLGYTNLG